MIVFIAFGALMVLISLSMAIDPGGFSGRLERFSEWRWFHWFEVTTRLLLGIAFILFANDFIYSGIATGFGYLFIAVAFGLVVSGPTRHRQFARRAASEGRRWFRLAGLAGCLFGISLVYLATLGS